MNFAKYRLAIQLFKIYNGDDYNDDWLDMNRQQNFNARCDMFQISNCSNIKIGRNIMCNRLTVLNRQIKLDWLNLSLTAFKLKSKQTFLSNWLLTLATWLIIFLKCKWPYLRWKIKYSNSNSNHNTLYIVALWSQKTTEQLGEVPNVMERCLEITRCFTVSYWFWLSIYRILNMQKIFVVITLCKQQPNSSKQTYSLP